MASKYNDLKKQQEVARAKALAEAVVQRARAEPERDRYREQLMMAARALQTSLAPHLAEMERDGFTARVSREVIDDTVGGKGTAYGVRGYNLEYVSLNIEHWNWCNRTTFGDTFWDKLWSVARRFRDYSAAANCGVFVVSDKPLYCFSIYDESRRKSVQLHDRDLAADEMVRRVVDVAARPEFIRRPAIPRRRG